MEKRKRRKKLRFNIVYTYNIKYSLARRKKKKKYRKECAEEKKSKQSRLPF